MKKIFIVFVLIFFIFTSSVCFAYPNYTWSTVDLTVDASSAISNENLDDVSNPLNLDCGSCILIEQNTGQVLYSYNSHEKLKPASVTKLMSIYLIM